MDPRHRTYIILASILLHVLFFLLWEGAIELKIIKADVAPQTQTVKQNEPIVFDLQQELPRQVIETPEDAQVTAKQAHADFLSDKNALARNPETNPALDTGDAFARGDLNSHELPTIQGPPGKKQPPPVPVPDEKGKKETGKITDTEPPNYLTETSTTAFLKEYVMNRPNPTNPGIQDHLPTVEHDNQASRARDMGGLSFNTYDWEFAPYMLALKYRIQGNIFPPQAFTHLGLISGETLLRFKIYPDGALRDLQILDYNGHKSLMETSSRAVEISAPFPKLPANFPEPYLEVTGKFVYFVRK